MYCWILYVLGNKTAFSLIAKLTKIEYLIYKEQNN